MICLPRYVSRSGSTAGFCCGSPLLAAVAIQFALNALQQLNPAWFPDPA